MDAQHKIALITGGSRGLGREMALSLAGKGTDVVITYRTNRRQAEEVVSAMEKMGRKALALQLEVTDPHHYPIFFSDQFLPQLKTKFDTAKFDFLINNAGTGLHTPLTEKTEITKVEDLFNVHFKAGYFLTQEALPYMNPGGAIINVSSGLTRITNPGQAAYAAMKGALEVLTRYQAKEFGSRGIRANIVAPGAIETDFGGGLVRDNKEVNSFIASHTALGRVGLPTDIGPVVAFLCSDDASWINGQRIEVSGGQQL